MQLTEKGVLLGRFPVPPRGLADEGSPNPLDLDGAWPARAVSRTAPGDHAPWTWVFSGEGQGDVRVCTDGGPPRYEALRPVGFFVMAGERPQDEAGDE